MTTRFSGIRSVAKNSTFLVSTQMASLLIRFIYLFILARTLQASAYGALNYALSWYLVVLPLTYLGADVVLGREIGRSKDHARGLLGATLSMRLSAGMLATIGSIFVGIYSEGNGYVRELISLFSFALIGRSLWMWSASVFTAFEEAHLMLPFEVTTRLMEVAALLLLLATVGPDLRGIALVHACSWLLQGLAGIVVVLRRYGISFNRPEFGWLQLLREGLPGATFAIAIAAFFQLPIVLFREFNGIGDRLGHFALGFQLVTYLLTIPTLIAQAGLPVLARSAARRDGKIRSAALLLIVVIVLGGIIISIIGSLAARPLVNGVFGLQHGPAAEVFAEALWLLIPASLATLFQNLLFAHGSSSVAVAGGPLLGVAAMILLFVVAGSGQNYSSALLSVGTGLSLWFIIGITEIFRARIFSPKMSDYSSLTS